MKTLNLIRVGYSRTMDDGSFIDGKATLAIETGIVSGITFDESTKVLADTMEENGYTIEGESISFRFGYPSGTTIVKDFKDNTLSKNDREDIIDWVKTFPQSFPYLSKQTA